METLAHRARLNFYARSQVCHTDILGLPVDFSKSDDKVVLLHL